MTTVLVINSGSSSMKFQVIETDRGEALAVGIVERIGQPSGTARLTAGADERSWSGPVPDHDVAFAQATALLAEAGVRTDELVAIGHRVVHGGTAFDRPTLIDATVLQQIRKLAPLAPLHNPANASGIEQATAAFPSIPQVAVFDTSFFAALPPVASTYAIDRDVAREHHLRRYGFHGISHDYVSRVVARFLGRTDLRQIVLHLGNGASVSAIDHGRPVETSMGLTPLEGLVMGTRSGDIDPGALLYLSRVAGLSIDGLDDLLNQRSGILGLAGVSDFRDLHRLIDSGKPDAELAWSVYGHRARKYIGAYLAVLGGADTVTFTAGVGENDARTREMIVRGLAPLGIAIDPARNALRSTEPRIISPDGSAVTVLVVPTNEELAIARAAAALV